MEFYLLNIKNKIQSLAIYCANNGNIDMEKLKENLSLYLNQLSQSNLATIQSKIAKEIEYSSDSQNMLIDLILTNGLSQSNNLPVLLQLLYNLKLISQLAGIQEKKLFENTLKETDASNYDQMCDFNRFNLIYKNGYIFLGLIYNKCGEISLQRLIKLFHLLESNIVDENKSKELTEKYIDIYVEFIRLVGAQLKKTSNDIYNDILNKLIKNKTFIR